MCVSFCIPSFPLLYNRTSASCRLFIWPAINLKQLSLVQFKAPWLENPGRRFCFCTNHEWTRIDTNYGASAACPRRAAAHRSKLKIIVILMRADPEPVVMALPLAGESAIAATDLSGVNAPFLA